MLSGINLIVIACAAIFAIVLAIQKVIDVAIDRSKREAYEKKFEQMQSWRVSGNVHMDKLRAQLSESGDAIEGEYEKLD